MWLIDSPCTWAARTRMYIHTYIHTYIHRLEICYAALAGCRPGSNDRGRCISHQVNRTGRPPPRPPIAYGEGWRFQLSLCSGVFVVMFDLCMYVCM
jgi:hypothetical protein